MRMSKREQNRRIRAQKESRNNGARNGFKRADRDWSQIGEDAVLNRRRHGELQTLAKDNSKNDVRKIMREDPQLDNGIRKQD